MSGECDICGEHTLECNCKMYNQSKAYLFSNGNAAFFDKNGKQMGLLQADGWKGLHAFIDQYPHSRIHMQQCDDIDSTMLPYLLKHIKKPRKVK